MTIENATDIGEALGNLIMIEEDPIFGIACRKFIRIKVEIDVTNPLKQGLLLSREGNLPT